MVYLAELLVVRTDRLKIIRIRARNVPRKQTQVPRRLRISCISLSLQESDGIARWCAVLLKHKKSSPDNLHMSGIGLWVRKLSRQYALFTLTPNLSNPVLGKNLEHPHLTRQCSDVRQVRWKIIYIAWAYNFSHFAIYLPKFIKIHGNLTKSSDRNKNAQFFLRHVV